MLGGVYSVTHSYVVLHAAQDKPHPPYHLVLLCSCLRHRKAEIVKRRPYDELELSKTTDYRHDTDVSKDRAPFYAPVKS